MGHSWTRGLAVLPVGQLYSVRKTVSICLSLPLSPSMSQHITVTLISHPMPMSKDTDSETTITEPGFSRPITGFNSFCYRSSTGRFSLVHVQPLMSIFGVPHY
ncbi:hypothetical protein BDR04DRAFT_164363 [Suillus decipiens]|nr:hypothetical protein BDR04DRAFT_164363 [Suillus decipiens]